MRDEICRDQVQLEEDRAGACYFCKSRYFLVSTSFIKSYFDVA